MNRGLAAAGIVLALLASASRAQAPSPAEPVRQPVDFNHRRHAERGVQCAFCHATARTGEAAGLPDAALCLGCHETGGAEGSATRSLARYAGTGEPIPWVRIYRLPGFVFFGHDRHAGARCEQCHGPVARRDVLAREKDLSMKMCVDCHKTSRAPTACNLCHEIER